MVMLGPRVMHIAGSRPTVAPSILPKSAPNDAQRTRVGPLRVEDPAAGIEAIPILAPLLQAAVHVVETPGIGQLLPDRVGSATAIDVIPGIVGQIGIAGIIGVAEAGRGAGAAGILPFGFGGQPIYSVRRNVTGGALLLRKLGAITRGLKPRCAVHRTTQVHTVAVVVEVARIAADQGQVLALGDQVLR